MIKVRTRGVFFLGAVCVGIGCGDSPAETELGNAHLEIASSELSAEQQADILLAKQNRIRQHFADRLSRLNVVATTKTDSGTIVDWVPRAAGLAHPQLSKEQLAEEPTRPLRKGEEYAQTELEAQSWNRGPEGTVPVIRFDVDAYLAAMGEDIPDDPSKGLIPRPSPEANNRYYAEWRLAGSSYRAMRGQINIWDAPQLESSGDTNIGQILAGRGGQTVEAGKIESAGINSGHATLFAYYTTNNYAYDADWVGGYAGFYDGFVQYSSTVAPLDQYAYVSADGGGQIIADYRLVHFAEDEPGYGENETYEYQAGWWLAQIKNTNQVEWIGYWPRCHDAAQGVACSDLPNWTWVDDNGLDMFANDVRTYGEVYDHHAPAATTTDMGSGKDSSTDYTHAAYMEYVQVIPRYSGDSAFTLFQNAAGTRTTHVTQSTCYSMATPYLTSADNWFFYGGKGKLTGSCN
jgi:hypothetical protein